MHVAARKEQRKSAKQVIERLALEAEKQAWDESNPVAVFKLVERITTLNQVAVRMEWWTLNARLQRTIDKLTEEIAKWSSHEKLILSRVSDR